MGTIARFFNWNMSHKFHEMMFYEYSTWVSPSQNILIYMNTGQRKELKFHVYFHNWRISLAIKFLKFQLHMCQKAFIHEISVQKSLIVCQYDIESKQLTSLDIYPQYLRQPTKSHIRIYRKALISSAEHLIGNDRFRDNGTDSPDLHEAPCLITTRW